MSNTTHMIMTETEQKALASVKNIQRKRISLQKECTSAIEILVSLLKEQGGAVEFALSDFWQERINGNASHCMNAYDDEGYAFQYFKNGKGYLGWLTQISLISVDSQEDVLLTIIESSGEQQVRLREIETTDVDALIFFAVGAAHN